MEKFEAKQAKLKEQKQAQPVKAATEKPKKGKKEDEVPVDNTPPGEKKGEPRAIRALDPSYSPPPRASTDQSGPMPSAYYPKYVEAAWYPWWKKNGFFKPERVRRSRDCARRPCAHRLPRVGRQA